MNRSEAKKLMPIIQAFSEGAQIQIKCIGGKWETLTESEGLPMNTLIDEPSNFRIKPEPKYRPFANAEECFEEMQKHQPVGWVKDKSDGHPVFIGCVTDNYGCSLNGNDGWYFKDIIDHYSFADGSVFGKLEKE